MKNLDVINAWKKGVSAKTKNLSTDGRELYSYALLIGYTDDLSRKVVKNYTKENYYSVTTSIHVNMAKKASSITEEV